MLITAPRETRRAQRIQRCRPSQGNQPCRGQSKHVRESRCGQIFWGGPSDYGYRYGLEGILQGVGQDDGDGAFEEDFGFVPDEP